MKVAIVHDDLVQWGGAERVLLGLCEIFPDAPIFTSVVDWDNLILKDHFVHKKIITSFLQKIPGWKFLYRSLLPLYPFAFEQFDFDGYYLVISNTTRFAKSIITKPRTKHICYCHTPPRFLWHFSGYGNYGIGEILMTKLRILDTILARRVDLFIAGSENAKKRIRKVYRMTSKVVYPFVDLERFKGVTPFDGGYFLVIARPTKYKRVDLAKEACRQMDVPLKVVDGSWEDRMLVRVLAGCRALIIPGVEDFGLVAIEAQALGKPVVGYNAGGVLETVVDESCGILFDDQTLTGLKSAIKRLDSKKNNPSACFNNAQRFSKENFKKNFKQVLSL